MVNLHQDLEPAVRRAQVSDVYVSLAELSELQQTLAKESSDLFLRVRRLEGAEAQVRIAFRSLKRILVLPPSSQQQPSPEQPSSSGQPSSSREPRFSPYGMRLPSLPDPHPSGFDSPGDGQRTVRGWSGGGHGAVMVWSGGGQGGGQGAVA